MTQTNGSRSLVLRRIVLAACALALVAATVPAEAGQRRARLSRDLRDRLSARVEASTDIIVTRERRAAPDPGDALRRAHQEAAAQLPRSSR